MPLNSLISIYVYRASIHLFTRTRTRAFLKMFWLTDAADAVCYDFGHVHVVSPSPLSRCRSPSISSSRCKVRLWATGWRPFCWRMLRNGLGAIPVELFRVSRASYSDAAWQLMLLLLSWLPHHGATASWCYKTSAGLMLHLGTFFDPTLRQFGNITCISYAHCKRPLGPCVA